LSAEVMIPPGCTTGNIESRSDGRSTKARAYSAVTVDCRATVGQLRIDGDEVVHPVDLNAVASEVDERPVSVVGLGAERLQRLTMPPWSRSIASTVSNPACRSASATTLASRRGLGRAETKLDV